MAMPGGDPALIKKNMIEQDAILLLYQSVGSHTEAIIKSGFKRAGYAGFACRRNSSMSCAGSSVCATARPERGMLQLVFSWFAPLPCAGRGYRAQLVANPDLYRKRRCSTSAGLVDCAITSCLTDPISSAIAKWRWAIQAPRPAAWIVPSTTILHQGSAAWMLKRIRRRAFTIWMSTTAAKTAAARKTTSRRKTLAAIRGTTRQFIEEWIPAASPGWLDILERSTAPPPAHRKIDTE